MYDTDEADYEHESMASDFATLVGWLAMGAVAGAGFFLLLAGVRG